MSELLKSVQELSTTAKATLSTAGITITGLVGAAVVGYQEEVMYILNFGKDTVKLVKDYPGATAIIGMTGTFFLGKWRGRQQEKKERQETEDLNFARTFTLSRTIINPQGQMEIKNTREEPIATFTKDMGPLGKEVYAKSKLCDEKTMIVPLIPTGAYNEGFIYDKFGQTLERENNEGIDSTLSAIEKGADYVKDEQYGSIFFEPQYGHTGTKTEAKSRAIMFSGTTIAKALNFFKSDSDDVDFKGSLEEICNEGINERNLFLDAFIKHMLNIPLEASLDDYTKTDMGRRNLVGNERLPRPIDRKRFLALAHLIRHIFIDGRSYIKYNQYIKGTDIKMEERKRIEDSTTEINSALSKIQKKKA